MTAMELNRDNIQQLVDISQEKLVALVFWAEQMPETKALLAQMEQIAASYQGLLQLASVNCETQMELASYFRIQSLPTTLLLSQGQPIDGFAGALEEPKIREMLAKHLPAAWELALNEAKALLAEGNAAAALPLIKQAHSEQPNGDVTLAYADISLALGDVEAAKTLLATVKLEDQRGDYESLMSRVKLAEQAADTPEIRNLQQAYEQHPEDLDVLAKLASALHQAQRNEEALELLFTPLKQDLNAANGALKQQLLTILSALGQGNPLASQYRRKLYSLLY
ncbi:tetratricopeptide repeat protein [Shewanella sp. C32]|uniref:Tetratricopeptide repeat protein n=1 Tax=Shewanella electrica TaxID=515560 RepID=A0ABT2FLH0_9GAMM|nr:tetratricopeptide repeat protein [Shewanella electrica]MCH1924751.1 tetratricopeptide repeat protein [Shewanella electrica]MCS4556802.1 tetratricopeptide repeat protein [Shewanella electrica]